MQMFEKMDKPAKLLFFDKSSSEEKPSSNIKNKVQFACDDDDEYVSKGSSTPRTTIHGNKQCRGGSNRKVCRVAPSSSSIFYTRTPRLGYWSLSRAFPNSIWHGFLGGLQQSSPLPLYQLMGQLSSLIDIYKLLYHELLKLLLYFQRHGLWVFCFCFFFTITTNAGRILIFFLSLVSTSPFLCVELYKKTDYWE